MKEIGLSYDEIDAILKNALAPEKYADVEATRDVIAKAITENNKKILKDIEHIISK